MDTEPLAAASEAGLFALGSEGMEPRSHALRLNWRLPVILISFSDDTLRYGPADFERMLFDTSHAMPFGSAAEYYTTVSGGRLGLTGRVVATVRLPHTQAYYCAGNSGLNWYGTPHNSYGALWDALRICEGSVSWPEFDLDYDGYVDMVWMVHAGVGGEGGDGNKLWSLTSRTTSGWEDGSPFATTSIVPGTFDRPMLIDRFTILPERSLVHPGELSEIGVYCHEFGHTLGLPDLYDVSNPRNSGPGNWSLMSSGAYGGDGRSPELPTHLGAWPLSYLGWASTVRPAADAILELQPLGRGADLVDFWFQGNRSPDHFLIENREPIGYDARLPGRGLIVYHVNERVISLGIAGNRINSGDDQGLVLVEADGDGDLVAGRNRGDPNDPFPGALGLQSMDDFTHPSTRTFSGRLSNIALEEVALDGDVARFRLRVRPLGWLPGEDLTEPGFAPLPTRSSARASGRDPLGVAYVAMCESRNGHAQVVMRSSLAWDQPLTMSASTTAAIDPSLAVLPTGDLALVWADSRHGRFDVFYRTRIRGVWTAERSIVSLAGNCRTPSLASDGRGGLYLAFQYQSAETLQVMLARFNYAAPRVQPLIVAMAPYRPENPQIVVGRDGHGFVVWQDRGPLGQLWFSSFRPDTLVSEPRMVADWISGQSSFVTTMDSLGGLHVLRNVTGPGINELRYAVRPFGGAPSEIVLETVDAPLELMALEVDPQRSVHVAYGVSGNGVRLRYRRLWPDGNWDAESTDLSFPNDEIGGQPVLLPRREGNLDLVYTGQRDGQPRFMVRKRVLHVELPLALEAQPEARRAPRLLLAPNPVRAGEPLVAWLTVEAGEPGTLDVFDAAGRRRAVLPLLASPARRRVELNRGVTRGWEDGVYFARLRGSPAAAARFVVIH